jgi:hypothetical protein
MMLTDVTLYQLPVGVDPGAPQGERGVGSGTISLRHFLNIDRRKSAKN